MKIITDLIPVGKYGVEDVARRRGILLENGVGFFVDHDTGNPNSTARGNVDYFKRTYNKDSASAHIFIDDVEAIMCIPAFENAERAHHVLYNITKDNDKYGDDANDYAIGLELCYFPKDVARTRKAYENYVEVASDLCIFHNVNPSYREGHFELDGDRKTDPNNALKILGLSYDNMKEDIAKMYEEKKKSWQQEIGEKALDELFNKELINNSEDWKKHDLENEPVPLWLFFELLNRSN